ncbi:N-acetyltransferase [Pseudovibrio japonicus]|uniref:N-acetyltransferase n=1 Tax=Pseudovibrio japonicus TaxID=366534 RepID=A0ABQ3EQC6_9HYPH|nr:GNAT family N-acetyltransferase [Pseudovibrio japonicus]GHB48269.1 N-acetyltransferase [Pseudovibrio japonicus]
MSVSVGIEDPRQDDVVALVEQLTQTLLELTPAEACHHMSVKEMAGADTTVFVAREAGKAIACGALRLHSSDTGEVKRMFSLPETQGKGVGRRILQKIIAHAEEAGLTSLVLETGWNYEAAIRLYESSGFERCGPVLDYPEHPESVFYKKPLAAVLEM